MKYCKTDLIGKRKTNNWKIVEIIRVQLEKYYYFTKECGLSNSCLLRQQL